MRIKFKQARERRSSLSKARAFSVVELLVVVSILLIASAVLIPVSRSAYQRDVLNQAITSLESWLVEVSRSPDLDGQTCVVTFTTGGPLTRGSSIASVSPTSCATTSTVTLPTTQGQTFSVGATSEIGRAHV